MPLLNENYQNLEESYLFAEIARRVSKYEEAHPDQKIIRLGIGDVTKPLTKKVIEALHKSGGGAGGFRNLPGIRTGERI